jgi:cysteine synthase A
MLHDNILGTVGNTPIVRINKLAPNGVTMYAKLEAFNPMSSVKDRLALGIILDAEQRGVLKPGQVVVEATSGNTGVALAMVCAVRGYPFVAFMADSFSIERRKLMRALGAKVILTPAPLGATGMIDKCKELAAAHGWWMSRQFENEANPAYHAKTTAQEILRDFPEGLDYWVTGFGTGGTLKGVASVLREKSPKTKIVVGEPETAPMLTSHSEQPRNADGSPSARNTAWKPHPFQGWSPDFIPKILGDAVDAKLIDEVLLIPGPDGIKMSQQLAQKEGIFVGISSGGTFAAALKVAEKAAPGSTILCMLPDTGERYLSTPLFADVPADMTEEEVGISASTPGQQLPPKPAA